MDEQLVGSCCHALTVRNLHQQDALASQADWDWSEAIMWAMKQHITVSSRTD